MTLWEYYLQYTSGVLDGSKPCPAGITIEGTDEMARAASLLTQAEKLGMDGFVKACAAAEGVEIPQDVFDDYKPQEIEALLQQLPGAQEPQRDNAYAALLDCCALEDGLMQYLIEVLRTGDAAGFYRLARVTTRTDVKPEAFLAWLGSLEDRAEPEERECAQIMDGCLRRLVQEGRGEVAAALISSDEQTFTAFRREAPELRNRPEATVEWFLTHYVDTYYPIRFLLAANGVEFPKSHKIN